MAWLTPCSKLCQTGISRCLGSRKWSSWRSDGVCMVKAALSPPAAGCTNIPLHKLKWSWQRSHNVPMGESGMDSDLMLSVMPREIFTSPHSQKEVCLSDLKQTNSIVLHHIKWKWPQLWDVLPRVDSLMCAGSKAGPDAYSQTISCILVACTGWFQCPEICICRGSLISFGYTE